MAVEDGLKIELGKQGIFVTTIEERARVSAAKNAERRARKQARRATLSASVGAIAVRDGGDKS